MLVLAVMVAPARPAHVVSIYVGPVVREDGFVAVNRDLLDSVEDLRAELRYEIEGALKNLKKQERKTWAFRIVDDAAAADVRLYVEERFTGWSDGGYIGSATKIGSTVVGFAGPTVNSYGILKARLQAGTYEQPLVAAVGSWTKLARSIARDVSVWVVANRERLAVTVGSDATAAGHGESPMAMDPGAVKPAATAKRCTAWYSYGTCREWQ